MTAPKALPLHRWPAVLAVAVVLGGCSTSADATGGTTTRGMTTPRTTPSGSRATPAASPLPSATSTSARPSAAALMVCGAEIGADVRTLFRLPNRPVPAATWSSAVYRCSYRLPQGQLVLAVSEDGTHRAALARLAAARHRATRPRTISGLASFGLPAFATTDGAVVFAKDDKTLTVDASGLTDGSIPDRQPRSDVAYQIASDVLSCWRE